MGGGGGVCVGFPCRTGSETLKPWPTFSNLLQGGSGECRDERGDCRLLGAGTDPLHLPRRGSSTCTARGLSSRGGGGLLAGSLEGTGSRLLAVRLARPHIDAAEYRRGDRPPDLSRGGAASGQDCEHRGNGADLARSGKSKTPDPAPSS